MKTALLIVDMQNDIAHPDGRLFIPEAAHRAEIMGGVLDAFRDAGQPVIHIVRSHRADGWDVERFRMPGFEAGRGFAVEGSWGIRPLQRVEPRETEPIVVKRRFSGFMGTELDLLLRRASIGRVFVIGVSLPNGPRATMFDAVSLDYEVVAVEDALASASEETRAANFKDLSAIGIRIATADEAIREIMRAGDRAPTEGTTR